MAKTITESVGIGCKNRPLDVKTIQQLLNGVPINQGGPMPKLVDDGAFGPISQSALQGFQLKQFGWQGNDGQVFPGGETLAALNKFNDPSNPAPASQDPGQPAFFGDALHPTTQSFRIRAVRCGVSMTTNDDGEVDGVITDGGFHYELHDPINMRVAVFTLVNEADPNAFFSSQFSGRPLVQYCEFTIFRSQLPYRLEDFRDVPVEQTLFFKAFGDGTIVPSFSRLKLQMPGGEVLFVPVNEFSDSFEPGGASDTTTTPMGRFMINRLPGTWVPRG